MEHSDSYEKGYVPPDFEQTGEFPVVPPPVQEPGLFDEFFAAGEKKPSRTRGRWRRRRKNAQAGAVTAQGLEGAAVERPGSPTHQAPPAPVFPPPLPAGLAVTVDPAGPGDPTETRVDVDPVEPKLTQEAVTEPADAMANAGAAEATVVDPVPEFATEPVAESAPEAVSDVTTDPAETVTPDPRPDQVIVEATVWPPPVPAAPGQSAGNATEQAEQARDGAEPAAGPATERAAGPAAEPAAAPATGRNGRAELTAVDLKPPARPPAAPPSSGTAAPGGWSSRRLPAAIAAVIVAIVVTGGVILLFHGSGGDRKVAAKCPGEACPATPSRTLSPKASAGPKLPYRTVDREVGYFEGTIMIVNRTDSPMRAWTLSFTYPGADVHNAWEVDLQRTGENVVINSAATARPIAPGESFEVRFGGAGRPTLPQDCSLNGLPCTFTR